MNKAIVGRLKEIKQIRVVGKQLKGTLRFFLRFAKRKPFLFFHSPGIAFVKAKKRPSSIAGKIDQTLLDGLTFHQDVIVYPLGPGKHLDFSGGLVDSKSRQLVREAIHARVVLCQECPTSDDLQVLDADIPEIGHLVLFGGILFNNFGHFLLESLSRLWAYEYVRELDPYIFFYEDMGKSNYLEKRNFINQVFTGFNIPLKRIFFLDRITKIKNILIPSQKYGYEFCRQPDNIFLRFMHSFKFPRLIPKGFEKSNKIYVSRSKMPYGFGKLMGEELFEDYLRLNGYNIFHPEFYSLYEQLTVYSRTTKIIFCDGAALHGCILLPQLESAVAVIARRRHPQWKFKEITDQFQGYGKKVLWIDEVLKQYQFGLESWSAITLIDWYKISNLLKVEGFVDSAFENFNGIDYTDLIRTEIFNHIQSINRNSEFIEFMMKQDETGLKSFS